MTSLEIGMAFMLGLTVLLGISAVALPGDPLRMTRVLLAVGSAIVFQLHVVLEGARPDHWPLYLAGLVVLIAVGAHWFWSSPAVPPDDPPAPD